MDVTAINHWRLPGWRAIAVAFGVGLVQWAQSGQHTL